MVETIPLVRILDAYRSRENLVHIVDCLEIVRELKRLPNPVGVLFETEGIYTLDGTQGEMMLSVMAMTAQEESQPMNQIRMPLHGVI